MMSKRSKTHKSKTKRQEIQSRYSTHTNQAQNTTQADDNIFSQHLQGQMEQRWQPQSTLGQPAESLSSTNNIYLSFSPRQFSPLETFGMPHQMMPMFPFAGFVLCAQKLQGTFIFGITQSFSFLPPLVGTLRGLLMWVICPLMLNTQSQCIWVDAVAVGSILLQQSVRRREAEFLCCSLIIFRCAPGVFGQPLWSRLSILKLNDRLPIDFH